MRARAEPPPTRGAAKPQAIRTHSPTPFAQCRSGRVAAAASAAAAAAPAVTVVVSPRTCAVLRWIRRSSSAPLPPSAARPRPFPRLPPILRPHICAATLTALRARISRELRAPRPPYATRAQFSPEQSARSTPGTRIAGGKVVQRPRRLLGDIVSILVPARLFRSGGRWLVRRAPRRLLN